VNELIQSKSNIKTFSCDLRQLTKVQMSFIELDKNFIYFRKGEAVNNVIIYLGWAIKLAIALKIVDPVISIAKKYKDFDANIIEGSKNPRMLERLLESIEDKLPFGYFPPEIIENCRELDELIEKKLRAGFSCNLPHFREIGCPDKSDILMTFEKLKRIGGDTQYLPKEYRGSFLFFVNDRKFCLFTKRRDWTFNGFIGTNLDIITTLKEVFEQEWDMLRIINRDSPRREVKNPLQGGDITGNF